MNNSDQNIRIRELASRWMDNSISPKEEVAFAAWYNEMQSLPLEIPVDYAANSGIHKNRIYQKIMKEIHSEPTSKKKLWFQISAAAAIFLILSFAIYFYIGPDKKYNLDELADRSHPGNSMAVWINKDGKQRLLDDSVFNVPAKTKTKYNQLGATSQILTPKGAHYRIVLEDGTKVWLSAASSLTYPDSFSGLERVVQLSGEAYFEVAHDSSKPFHVHVTTNTNKQDIEVLGTKFNVSGYKDDEEIKTSVLEGSVKISTDKNQIVLTAGQEASLKSGRLSTEVVEMLKIINKTKHETLFIDGNIRQIMRKVSRLYNVDIEYRGVISDEVLFKGTIIETSGLKDFIQILDMTGQYHFHIEGKKVIVSDYVNRTH